ncbi:MAG TPA: 3-deoxy-manno-octulosonate cytidylyltransferase [Alphaproteobacteria bacterium]|jgi:3-deoxy-manno-octulosonate cytidylyltransferase (CMP-KDO synthetase)|nr:3-deoxy-manno-octulosonate cytidylyltransferase [Alphaproteobacteria bacterium]
MADFLTPPTNPIVLIPARLAATRLPNKPLLEIAGEPMIVQVWRRAMEAGIGPVVVTAPDPEIIAAVEAAGGQAQLTSIAHQSGSDRIAEALERVDPNGRYDAVINVQGDLPVLEPETIRATFRLLADPKVDIATPVALAAEDERENPNVVKAVFEPTGERTGKALYFTRLSAPSGAGPLYHHIGLYAYRRAALQAFVAAPQSELEKRERLEQLRALAIGLNIHVAVVDTVPLGVDTQADLDRARALLEHS